MFSEATRKRESGALAPASVVRCRIKRSTEVEDGSGGGGGERGGMGGAGHRAAASRTQQAALAPR